MKHERMKVLEMLESGKITAEEATKLLEAMKSAGGGSHTFTFDDETERDVEEKLNRFTQGVDNFTRDFGGRVETFYRDIEPKIKKASQSVLEKTAAVFDEISRSLNESLENARNAGNEANPEDCGCGCGCDGEANHESNPDDGPREN